MIRTQEERASMPNPFGPASMLMLWIPALSGQQHQESHPPDAGQHHGGALYGDYDPGRESSGTSWLPGSTPMEGYQFGAGEWAFMVHGFVNFVYQEESEPRGSSESFSTNAAMLTVQRPLGAGKLGVRFMGSLEPTLGPEGYPLLLQTGETADGANPLFDRQHPHDVLMEAALSYSRPISAKNSFFVYIAPVGEPAFGPPAFMHRFSASDNPVPPIVHHWFDSTHITYGVLTLGLVHRDKLKLDGSIFNGREPDPERWDVDPIRLNSYSMRFTLNPAPNWSVQASFAQLDSPEQIHQGIDVIRLSASAAYNRRLSGGNWQTTLAWGRNKRARTFLTYQPPSTGGTTHVHVVPGQFGVSPVLTQNALFAETALRLKERHTVFARMEFAEKDELFAASDPRHALVTNVSKLSGGYVFDFLGLGHLRIGVGGYGSVHFLDEELNDLYGERPTSYGVYLRLKIL
jgi:hypothetical protein